MSIPFLRSTRAITNDFFRPSLVGLTIAVLLLVGWGVWFLWAGLPVYATSTDSQLTRDGFVIAKFAPSDFANIQPGMEGVAKGGTPNQTWQARVMETAIPGYNRMEANTARIYVDATPPLQAPPSEVRVQTAQMSPLSLLLQSAQQTAQK